MAINFLIMYIVFPFVLLYKTRVDRKYYPENKEIVLFTKEDTNFLKGMAAFMVVFAHYCLRLQEEGRFDKLFVPFRSLGPLGVAIFFFVSGYGLYVSNGLKKQPISFLVRHIKNVYIPYLLVRMMFLPVAEIINIEVKNVMSAICYIVGITIRPSWFIVIILIMYVFYWLVSQFVMSEKSKILLLICAVFILSGALFWGLGIDNSEWYGNNLIFPLGVLFGYFRKEIKKILHEKFFFFFVLDSVFLIITVLLFFKLDNILLLFDKFCIGVFLCLFIVLLLQKFSFRSKIMQWLGKHSIYLYLVHTNIYLIMRHIFGDMSGNLVTICYFAVTILVSFFLKYMIDALLRLIKF